MEGNLEFLSCDGSGNSIVISNLRAASEQVVSEKDSLPTTFGGPEIMIMSIYNEKEQFVGCYVFKGFTQREASNYFFKNNYKECSECRFNEALNNSDNARKEYENAKKSLSDIFSSKQGGKGGKK